jgi:hypothetical protein
MAAQQTLLQISQAVVDELGLPAITSVIGNMTTTARQILALANRAGDELYQTHQWTASQNLNVINIGTPVTTAGDLVAGLTTISNIADTTGIVANAFAVTGIEIPTAARVVTVVDQHTIVMDEPAPITQLQSPMIFARDTFDIPADFKWFLNRTMWDRTNHWELIGPISPQVDEWQRSGIVTVGPRKRWRQVGLPNTCWRIWPPPTATTDYPSTLVFEYESAFWVLGADGLTRKASFQADGDTPIVDSQAIVLSIKWRLWQIRGFEYGAMQAEALDYIARLSARDGGSADLTLGRRLTPEDYLLTPWSAPDGNFPAS